MAQIILNSTANIIIYEMLFSKYNYEVADCGIWVKFIGNKFFLTEAELKEFLRSKELINYTERLVEGVLKEIANAKKGGNQ